jgi:hypothetical protein
MMKRMICIAFLVAAIASAGLSAQSVNLSGTWRLNVAKSFMGQDHPFSDYLFTKRIVQSGDSITFTETGIHNSNVNIPLPDSESSMQVTADGKEHEVQLLSIKPNKSTATNRVTATWQGNTLELVQLVSGLATMTKHRLFLSEDGSQLVDLVEGHNIYGDLQQRLVFDKVQ